MNNRELHFIKTSDRSLRQHRGEAKPGEVGIAAGIEISVRFDKKANENVRIHRTHVVWGTKGAAVRRRYHMPKRRCGVQ